MDHLTALCLLRELTIYPDNDLFGLVESGELAKVVAGAERAAGGEPPGEPVAWTRRPGSLEDWQALFLSTFEVGVSAPKSPLQETFYVDSSSASQVIRENYLYYKHFGYARADDPSPHDSLPKQLGFLAHLEGLLVDPQASAEQRESVARAREDYLNRHLRSWLPKLLDRARSKGVDAFYVRALSALERLLRPEAMEDGNAAPLGTA